MIDTSASGGPVSRVVILGASNISLGWSSLLNVLRQQFAAPLEMYTAHGMGRSYCGVRSRFLATQLPGILTSQLWQQLPRYRPDDPLPCVLITDLGNDLVYGRSPLDVARAAEECIQRLRDWHPRCRIVVSRPPVESVKKVGGFRFLMCRLFLFPFCPLTLRQAQAATQELDELVMAMAREQEVDIVKPAPASYGLDPIHVKRRCRQDAFRTMLQPWQTERRPGERLLAGPLPQSPRPKQRWVWGRESNSPQPAAQRGGLSVFAY